MYEGFGWQDKKIRFLAGFKASGMKVPGAFLFSGLGLGFCYAVVERWVWGYESSKSK